MLQRIQSIWLFLAAVCAAATVKLSFYSGNKAAEAGMPSATTFTQVTAMSNVFLTSLTIAVFVGSLITIFNYKKRKGQIRGILMLILFSLSNIVLYYLETRKFVEGNFDLTALFALAIPIFLFLAMQGVRKDEKLVKSADRLR